MDLSSLQTRASFVYTCFLGVGGGGGDDDDSVTQTPRTISPEERLYSVKTVLS